MRQSTTASKVFDVSDLERDVAEVLAVRPPPIPVDFAPPALRLPSYLEHREGADDIGKLSAEAVGKAYELAAKEVEAMGEELKARVEKLEATKADAMAAIDEVKEVAARYRDEGKRVFLQIEDCALMTAEVRATCGTLKAKIAGPSDV